jgi:signal transduction histidine kinase
MIANLIDNAFKHNVSGTQILVSCRKLDRAVRISVLDTGRGIPKRLRDHIFEEFITEDDARSAYSGTGLGLSIAKRCADLNGATIEFSKKPRPPFSTEAVIIVPLADQDFKQ